MTAHFLFIESDKERMEYIKRMFINFSKLNHMLVPKYKALYKISYIITVPLIQQIKIQNCWPKFWVCCAQKFKFLKMTQRKVFLNQVQGALCFQPDLSTYYITADRAGIMGNPVCKHNFFTQAYYGIILNKKWHIYCSLNARQWRILLLYFYLTPFL